MTERGQILLAACLGAMAGGLAGYLFLTEDGRRVRERLEPGMEDLAREVRRLRGAMDSARVAAREGLAAIDDLRRTLPEAREAAAGAGRPRQAY